MSGIKKPLYLVFTDVIKSSIQRVEIFQTLKELFPLNPCLCLTGSSYKVTEVQGDSDLCDRFEMCGGVKQGCVLAVTIFSIEFPLLLNHAFSLLCS